MFRSSANQMYHTIEPTRLMLLPLYLRVLDGPPSLSIVNLPSVIARLLMLIIK